MTPALHTHTCSVSLLLSLSSLSCLPSLVSLFLHPQVKLLRITDAVTPLEFIGAEAGERTSRQKVALAEAKIAVLKPITAVQFNGMCEHLKSDALHAQVPSHPWLSLDLALHRLASCTARLAAPLR